MQPIIRSLSARPVRRCALPLLLALGCLLLPACRRRSAAKLEPSDNTGAPAAESQTSSAPGPGVPEARDPVVAATQVPLFTGTPQEMQAINLKIRDYWEYCGRAPRSIDDLVQAKLIPAPPKLPPGRQLVIAPDQWSARLQ